MAIWYVHMFYFPSHLNPNSTDALSINQAKQLNGFIKEALLNLKRN